MTLAKLVAADISFAIKNKQSIEISVFGNAATLFSDLQKDVEREKRMVWDVRQNELRLIWHQMVATPLEPAADGKPITALRFKAVLLCLVRVHALNSMNGISPNKIYLLGTNEHIETNVAQPAVEAGLPVVRLY